VLTVATTAAMLAQRTRHDTEVASSGDAAADDRPMSRTSVAVIVAAFVLLQAANAAVMSVMTLYVTESLGLHIMWGGVTLGIAAGPEIPALLLIGRLSDRVLAIGVVKRTVDAKNIDPATPRG
jgi:MFS transporter, SET family, sugar efflux transporter